MSSLRTRKGDSDEPYIPVSSPPMPKSELTAQEQIEYLATKVMRWHKVKARGRGAGVYIWATQDRDQDKHWDFAEEIYWNPLTDWNHWRQVEEKVMETAELKWRMIENIHPDDRQWLYFYMQADLPTRVSALISAHQDLYPEAQ